MSTGTPDEAVACMIAGQTSSSGRRTANDREAT
jgi:hypothetical protein